jgi:DUF1365 family protein
MRLLWEITMKSCIYTGHVGHRRYEPVGNHFRYSLFMMYLDLAELDQLFRKRFFWSVGRPNIAWFRRRDYLGDPDVPLDTAVRDLVKKKLGISPEGPIRMLTHLRYFGYIFNPVTFYYSFDRSDSRVETITADITNTPWGDRHSYLLDARDRNSSTDEMHFRFGKNFHVSPFMDMDMEYDWRFSEPGATLKVQMTNYRKNSKLFTANLDLTRLELNGCNLAGVLLSYPPMTLKVIAGIYWQALRLKMKGARFYAHPEKHETN